MQNSIDSARQKTKVEEKVDAKFIESSSVDSQLITS